MATPTTMKQLRLTTPIQTDTQQTRNTPWITNPTNATPDFLLSFPGGSNPAVMTFSPSSTGRTYTVFKTVGLTNPVWVAGTTCTGTVGSTTITNTLVLGPQYIQIRVNQPE